MNISHSKNGTALMGIMIAVLIIAGLAVGSFYLGAKPDGDIEGFETDISSPVQILDEAEKRINEANQASEDRKRLLENSGSPDAADTQKRPDNKEIVLNVKDGETVASPLLISGTTTLDAEQLTVELRNLERQALVSEKVNVKKAAGGNRFAITLNFEFSNTRKGYLAVYNGSSITEVLVDYAFENN